MAEDDGRVERTERAAAAKDGEDDCFVAPNGDLTDESGDLKDA